MRAIGFSRTRYLGLPLLMLMVVANCIVTPCAHARPNPSGRLEIHYINVEQGGATLIIGPDGTMIMYDFGKVSGTKIVKYLRHTVGLSPGEGIHYAIVSHGDKDHYMGYREVVADGAFDVLIANYEPGTTKPPAGTIFTNWLAPAKTTKAKAFKAIPVGLRISLGGGAEAHVVAANGVVLGETKGPKIRNENDRSIALFIRYGKFRYILDGDLGAGPEKCTHHDTDQLDVQTRVAYALISNGLMSKDEGVDVMHVAHHGSESSTSAEYYNMMKPKVALMSVGTNQGTFLHPRKDVVERVLLQTAEPKSVCVEAPPVRALLQTSKDKEKPCSATGCMSFKGAAVGNIVLSTDGETNYTIQVEHKPALTDYPYFNLPSKYPWEFSLQRR